MQSHSAEARVLAALGWLLPKSSNPAAVIRELLNDAPPTEPGEQQFVADGHTIIFAGVGALALMPAIAVMAGVAAVGGQEVARRVGSLLFVPAVFLLMLAQLVQVAKFRRRFDGVQPLLGRVSWAVCILVVPAEIILVGGG